MLHLVGRNQGLLAEHVLTRRMLCYYLRPVIEIEELAIDPPVVIDHISEGVKLLEPPGSECLAIRWQAMPCLLWIVYLVQLEHSVRLVHE